MSQHDFNIANQGFPAFRSDLNNALTALASNSSGDTPPSTTYANQFWYETDTNTLYFRNEDNDAWITLAVFDQTNDEWEVRTGVIQAVDSAGVSIKTDDGVARISVADNGTVTIGTVDINGGAIDGVTIGGASAGAVTATTITGSGDMNIDSGTLFVDVSTGNVGIGTDSPTVVSSGGNNLDIVGDFVGALRVERTNATNPTIGQFTATNGNLLTGTTTSSVYSFQVNSTTQMRLNTNGDLQFNSGYGSFATAYGCRAWVNFNGIGTVAIRADGNVSSITDAGTGIYTVNFTTAMPDDDFSVVSEPIRQSGSSVTVSTFEGLATSSVQIRVILEGSSYTDVGTVCVAVFR